MATPVRAVWPLPPRPAVLPLPEPMPRPTRLRVLVAPGTSLSSLSFTFVPSDLKYAARRRLKPLGLVDDAHEVADLGDHPADGGIVRQGRPAADPVELEANQRRALLGGTA